MARRALQSTAREGMARQLRAEIAVSDQVEASRIAAALESGGIDAGPRPSDPHPRGAAAADAIVVSSDLWTSPPAEEVRSVRERWPQARIIVVTPAATAARVRRALDAGADAVTLEQDIEAALAAVVQVVCSGQVSVPRAIHRQLERRPLSTREKQILGMVVLGFSNAEIAARLFLAESTVKSHLSSAFSKLGVRSRSEATERILDPNENLGPGILAISEPQLNGGRGFPHEK